MPTVAIVGRPNVGKSAIFNRLAGRRIAIVLDQPGVTRDRIAAPCALTERPCTVVDTGGIGASLDDGFLAQVTMEADIAMETADLILFVVDARDGITPIDQSLAAKMRKSKNKTPILLLINKADTDKFNAMVGDFASLGFGAGLPISAEHGLGFNVLAEKMDAVLAPLAEEEGAIAEEVAGTGLKLAIVGKPNVGKSSLVNAIFGSERTIVSATAGTTRDALDVPYTFEGEKFTLIDTAGLRQRSKMDTSVEVFSAMRTTKSIRRADLCLLVIDSAEGVSAMDRRIAKTIKEEGKPCLIVLNKFDLYHPGASRSSRLEEITEHVRRELFFLDYAPFIATSAKTGQSVDRILREALKVRDSAAHPMGTGALNRLLHLAFQKIPPAEHKKHGKRLKLFYATTAINEKYTAIPVPTYILFVNDKRLIHERYEQYLSNRIREAHPSPGLPITFSVRSRSSEKRHHEKE